MYCNTTSDNRPKSGFNASSSTDEGTCHTVVPITFSSISLINNFLPLAYHITDKLGNSFFSEIYVDFAALLLNCNKSEEIYNIGQAIKLTTTGNTIIRSLTSIMRWCNAFDIFMSIYISKYPNLALDLIEYGNNIRKLSVHHGFQAAKFYNEEFRKLRYVHRLLFMMSCGGWQWASAGILTIIPMLRHFY